MTTANLLLKVQTSGISLFVVGDKLRIEAPKGRLTPELRDEISQHKAEIIETLTGPALGNDPIGLFKREYRRLSTRLSRVMDADRDRGYLAWVRQHSPELWRSLENARGAWDVNERLEELKAGRIVWRDYRALMLRWARLHVKAIRLHRLALKERTAP